MRLVTGKDPVTGEDANRWVAAVWIGAEVLPWLKGSKLLDDAGGIAKAVDKVDDFGDRAKVAEAAGTAKVSIKEGGLNSSKYMEQLNNFSENKINHIINGSKNSNHGWEKLVPDKNWQDIKNIVNDVMENGVEGSYKKAAFSKKMVIEGFEVEVTYVKLSDGTVRISDGWINP